MSYNNLADRLNFVVNQKLNGNWAELARITKLQPSTLQAIKKGSDPRANTINSICEALNLNANWLLNGEGEIYKQAVKAANDPVADQRAQKMTGLYLALNEEDQKEILAVAEKKKRYSDLEEQVKRLSEKLG